MAMNENILGFELELNNLKDKKILFIATKNRDYIRIHQEIELLESIAKEITVIVFTDESYIKRICKVYLKLLFCNCNDYDVIFVGFMAQMIIPFFFRKFKYCKLYIDFFISLYDTLVFDRKLIKEKGILASLTKWFDSKSLKCADKIICDTRTHGEYFNEEFNVDCQKLRVLYLEANNTIYYPRMQQKPVIWKNKYIVLYFGSILPLQGVDIVLQTIELLKKEKNIHFILIGPIDKKYKRVESDTVTYFEWLSQERLAELIEVSDLCLAGHFSKDIEKADRTIPGKAFIYQSMKKKMILGDSRANREIFDDIHNLYVERGNAQRLGETIKLAIESI